MENFNNKRKRIDDYDEISILILHILGYNFFEQIMHVDEIIDNIFTYLDIHDISRIDQALLQKYSRKYFINSVKRVRYFPLGDIDIIVDINFCNWFIKKGISVKLLHEELIFIDEIAKYEFLSNCHELIELDTTGFDYNDLLTIVLNNPNIKSIDMCIDSLFNYNSDRSDNVGQNFKYIISHLQKITTLSLSINENTTESFKFLSILSNYCPNIKSIAFHLFESMNNDEFFNIVSKLHNLEEICLDANNCITPDGFFNSLENCTNIKKISILSTDINSDILERLSTGSRIIQELYAPVTFSDEQLVHYCDNTNITELTVLSVENSEDAITNKSIEYCYNFCKKLKKLNIKNTYANLDFLLASFCINNPHDLKALEINLYNNQYTKQFKSIYENQIYNKYFKNIILIVDRYYA